MFAESTGPGYENAERAFNQYSIDDRIKIQVLLTTAGYWPAVPNQDFNARIFGAIERFQNDNGYVPTGTLSSDQLDRLISLSAPLLSEWRFQVLRHPTEGVPIWTPTGMNLTAERTATGVRYSYYGGQIILWYHFFSGNSLSDTLSVSEKTLFEYNLHVGYSRLYKNDFFVIVANNDQIDTYTRFHSIAGGTIGFISQWAHNSPTLHGERIATLISGSLWSRV